MSPGWVVRRRYRLRRHGLGRTKIRVHTIKRAPRRPVLAAAAAWGCRLLRLPLTVSHHQAQVRHHRRNHHLQARSSFSQTIDSPRMPNCTKRVIPAAAPNRFWHSLQILESGVCSRHRQAQASHPCARRSFLWRSAGSDPTGGHISSRRAPKECGSIFHP